jgi:hypothetical protein
MLPRDVENNFETCRKSKEEDGLYWDAASWDDLTSTIWPVALLQEEHLLCLVEFTRPPAGDVVGLQVVKIRATANIGCIPLNRVRPCHFVLVNKGGNLLTESVEHLEYHVAFHSQLIGNDRCRIEWIRIIL